MRAVSVAEAPDLPIEGGAIPAALARLVMRLLQKDPHARFQTAQDLAWVLEQLTDVSAIDRTASPRVPARQRPGWLRWAVASAVLAAGLLGAWVYSNRAAAGDRAAATPMLPAFVIAKMNSSTTRERSCKHEIG